MQKNVFALSGRWLFNLCRFSQQQQDSKVLTLFLAEWHPFWISLSLVTDVFWPIQVLYLHIFSAAFSEKHFCSSSSLPCRALIYGDRPQYRSEAPEHSRNLLTLSNCQSVTMYFAAQTHPKFLHALWKWEGAYWMTKSAGFSSAFVSSSCGIKKTYMRSEHWVIIQGVCWYAGDTLISPRLVQTSCSAVNC